MLDWLRKVFVRRPAPPTILDQSPNDLFNWPADASLTPLDAEVVLALPRDLVAEDESLDAVLSLPADAQVGIPPTGDVFYVRLQPGMTAKLARACPVYLVPLDEGDTKQHRLRLSPAA